MKMSRSGNGLGSLSRFQEKYVSLNEFKLFQLTPERGFGGFAADILEKYLLEDS